MISVSSCLCALLLASYGSAAPAASSSAPIASTSVVSVSAPIAASSALPVSASFPVPVSSIVSSAAVSSAARPPKTSTDSIPPEPTAPTQPSPPAEYASTDPNGPMWGPDETDVNVMQPIRGDLGASLLGPNNPEMVSQNPDLLAPPTTDHGGFPNAKWPFSLSHNRLESAGWARNENVDQMPVATQMASVNMRLQAGAIRELHWHKTAEWAYVLSGSTQISSVDAEGRNYIATVHPGDLWYFPPGIPHALQATADSPDGSEFILVFDDGTFSEDSTFLLTDWMAHIPAEVIAKNFQTDPSAFSHIPADELYIFPATPPADDAKDPVGPQGTVPEPFSFAFSQVKPTQLNGGTVKVVDSTTFKISKTIAAAEVTVVPGGIRELHWHPTQDEWSLFLEGEGRVTIFASQSNARTFNYQAGDIGYVPATMGHYVENTGNSTLRFLEVWKTDTFQDISLNQWLALTPPAMVKAHLNLSDETIAKLTKTKNTVVGPA